MKKKKVLWLVLKHGIKFWSNVTFSDVALHVIQMSWDQLKTKADNGPTVLLSDGITMKTEHYGTTHIPLLLEKDGVACAFPTTT